MGMIRFFLHMSASAGVACAILLASACGGSSPPPSSASAEPPSHAAPSPPPPPETEPATEASPAPSAAESEAPPAPASEPAPEPEGPGPRSAPSAILATPNAAFIIDYNASAPKATADKTCEAEAGEDAAKKHECMQKARESFVADVLRFKKSAQGKWTWTVYQRKGSSLPEVYKADIDLTDEGKGSIKMKIKGGSKGAPPLFSATRQGVISFPNDYSITVEDPKHGHLVYDAKVGLVGD
jgi:hypothetical protein